MRRADWIFSKDWPAEFSCTNNWVIMRNIFLILILWVTGTPARAEIFVTSKHLVILRAGIDTVWGSYVFAVNNKDAVPLFLKVNIMMPSQMIDFFPQEGVSKEEVQLIDSGLMVEKEFAPGINVISIGFKVPSKFGKTDVTFKPQMDIDSFTLLLPRDGGVQIQSSELVLGDDESRPDPQYIPYVSKGILKTGSAFTIAVAGIPEGRLTLWITGGITGGLLLLAGMFLAIRTRPRILDAAQA